MVAMQPDGVLDRLVLDGAITGYTLEADGRYLGSGGPALTYAMYAGDPISRRNLGKLAAALTALGADVRVRGLVGTVRVAGRLHRSQQLGVLARFRRWKDLERAGRLVAERFTAGEPGCTPGSWHLPDARFCGPHQPPGTVAAFAHLRTRGTAAAVVLTLREEPPLVGMATRKVALHPAWGPYLAGGVECADRPFAYYRV